MAENKTIPTDLSVEQFLNAITDEKKRKDSYTVLEMMKEITGQPPVMWGSAIIGFGSYHYKYASGREGDSPLIGFSPRKQNLTLYLDGLEEADDMLKQLGKHSLGKVCLYIKRLDDVDQPTLKRLMEKSLKLTKQREKLE